MATSSAGTRAESQNFWRELVTRQGEAYEAYGRALKGFGQRSLPMEALVRDVVDLTARGAADVANTTVRFAQDYYRWAWSLVGISVDLEDDATSEPHGSTTVSSEDESVPEPEGPRTGTGRSSPRTPQQKG